jgi:F0F1-type ATP synthase assembly protein I
MPDPNDDFDEIELALRQAAKEHRIEIEPIGDTEDFEIELGNYADPSMSDEELAMRQAQLESNLVKISGESGLPDVEENSDQSEKDEVEVELDERLKKLETSAKAARANEHLRIGDQAQQRKADRSAALGLGIGMSIAYAIIGMPILGFFVGMLLENSSLLANGKMIGALVGIVLGFGFMIIQLRKYSDRQ